MTSAPIAPPQTRLAWLDVTRGLAIVAVVLYHTCGYLGIPNRLSGQAGVDAFLILSGFGLAYSHRDEPWKSFLTRRLLKLLPAYWITLLACAAFEVWVHRPPSLLQMVLSVTCLHLVAGDNYAFTINMSFWFMGLIVPLYFWFSLLRPWIKKGQGYAAIGLSIVAAWALGVLLLEYGTGWGPSSLGHVPARLPSFFIGAAAGLAFRRKETLTTLLQQPMLLLAAALLISVSIAGNWLAITMAVLSGFGVVALGMFISSVADRRRFARPLASLLTRVGVFSYELYLCHQYLLITVIPTLLRPRLGTAFPHMAPAGIVLADTLIALAASIVFAWGLRWIVNPKESRSNWRMDARVAATLTTLLVILAIVLPGKLPKVRARTFDIAVTLQGGVAPAGKLAEPVAFFGHFAAGDLIFLEHDGNGKARLGIDHFGSPVTVSDWRDVRALCEKPIHVTIQSRSLTVNAGGVTLASPQPPHVPNARPVIGLNATGFTTASRDAYSKITRLE